MKPHDNHRCLTRMRTTSILHSIPVVRQQPICSGPSSATYPWCVQLSICSSTISLSCQFHQIYFALRTVVDPKSFSLATLVLLMQVSQTVGNVFYSMVYRSSAMSHYAHAVKKLYSGTDLKPTTEFEEGELSYPPPDKCEGSGMDVEFR